MRRQLCLMAAAVTVLMAAFPSWGEEPLYKQFQPASSTHKPESIEWSNYMSFDTPDTDTPRLLLIGDSICNAYQSRVRPLLDGRMTMTFWASSKCATSPEYFRALDMVLSMENFSVISFNNGLHSLSADPAEWEAAYRGIVKFIRAKCPEAKLYLTLSTPLKDPALTAKSKALNQIVCQVASEEGLPTIDLFSVMDPLDRGEFWSDTFHFHGPAIEKQAQTIVETVLGE